SSRLPAAGICYASSGSRPMSLNMGTVGTLRNAAHDGLLKTRVRIDRGPEDAIGARGQDSGWRRRRLYARRRAASDAAVVGRADIPDCHPDERRPVAESDPGL